MAFADAVVAIAITLLVLPLVDIPSEEGMTSVAVIFGEHGAQFAMFGLSFAVIARLWLAHHNLGERMTHGDGWILVATLIWLVTVVFLPFPTELLGQLGNTRDVAAVYIATFLINVTALSLQGRRLASRPHLWREGWTAEQMRTWASGWWANPVLAALALLLCLLVPGVGIWALMVLFLDPLLSRLAVRRDAAAGEPLADR